jgi:outer membrane protein
MRHALAILGLALAPVLAAAQSTPARLSLADAMAVARENNPLYRQSLHDRSPAAWGVRNAYANFLPSVNSSLGFGYFGQGQQQFLGSTFSQNLATYSSSYNLGLNWTLSGFTLSQPGLKKAELAAADANVLDAESNLIADVTTQYLTVLQAVENAGVAQARLDHDKEFLVLAKARYDVGRATLIDVRQAEVARGQAEVGVLRANTSIDVEKLRLYEILGVPAPADLAQVQLTDSFPVTAPPWKLEELMTIAEQQNPSLKALRARESAANWGVKAATSSYGPSLSLSAGWSGFSQKVSDLNQAYAAGQAQADTNTILCNYQNTAWLNAGSQPLPCAALAFGAADSQAIRDANSRYPWQFTKQPFQLQLTVSLPLFTNFARPLQVSQAKAQRDDLTEAVRARGLAVRTQVSQAFLVLGSAYRAIAIQDTNRTAAREQLQLATDRYRVGSGTFFDLLDAQLQQLNAEVDYVSAVYGYHKAIAALEQAVGRRLR